MRHSRRCSALTLGLLFVTAIGSSLTAVPVVPPSPGVVTNGFCTHPTGFFKTNTVAAHRIHQYFGAAVGSEIFHVGDPSAHSYTWRKTGTLVSIGKGKNEVQVDSGVASMREAMTGGRPGAFSDSATNPTDMGTAGILGTQALALKINQGFSEVFVTPVTGFSGLTLVNMEGGVDLDGQALTPAQAAALDGQATLQVREATDVGLGGGAVSYGLSFGQLTSLIDLLNGSFDSCGPPSEFAQNHVYQPFVTSSAFFGERRPSTVSVFAYKPMYNTFSGEVVAVAPDPDGRRLGCTASSYVNFPTGKIALIERGVCTFYQKVSVANLAGASAAIIFNNTPTPTTSCPAQPTTGSTNCEALVGMGAAAGFTPLPIPAAFVQRSTGVLLRDATPPVTAFVQQ